jgi:hypothetical protein
VQPDGKIKANIINGSITADKLQPDYLADIIIQSNIAIANANTSKRWAVGGVISGDDIDNSKYYSQQSANSAALAAEYSSIVYPNLYIDTSTGELMSVGGQNITFSIDASGNLISEVSI